MRDSSNIPWAIFGSFSAAVIADVVREINRLPRFDYTGPPRVYGVGERMRLRKSKYTPHQGGREMARRRRQMGFD